MARGAMRDLAARRVGLDDAVDDLLRAEEGKLANRDRRRERRASRRRNRFFAPPSSP